MNAAPFLVVSRLLLLHYIYTPLYWKVENCEYEYYIGGESRHGEKTKVWKRRVYRYSKPLLRVERRRMDNYLLGNAAGIGLFRLVRLLI